ncbi:MAG: ABC transporter ATP-binding protein [Bacteroidetes bacterium RIFCSPLOWO2_02_FULL_36_8]|nr:MAG: ABC transporter ATP-binding protein [Bacteroidetes bacterium RIFCSPLOWO2_02_FULL_36_8]OFY69091.1 MAG: ABC transporter ATP-binding protein [Bacteroidetes bacterium RIFCSPLOWO2_12_FULL_37_12]
MLRITNISKSFDDKNVLDSISGEFLPGKVNYIIGASGSGKTVLLKCIVGLLKPDTGSVFFDDMNLVTALFNQRKKILREIGMLFQGSALFDSMNVQENILFPLDRFSQLNCEKKIERVNFCLERVKLSGSNKLSMSELSGGMRKRVGIARAIALNPRYLFCDEPNSGLDPQTSIVIDKLIKEITVEFNMTTLVVSHDMNSVLETGDSIIFIHQGKKCWEGNREEILHSDNTWLNEFVFAGPHQKMLRDKIENRK